MRLVGRVPSLDRFLVELVSEILGVFVAFRAVTFRAEDLKIVVFGLPTSRPRYDMVHVKRPFHLCRPT